MGGERVRAINVAVARERATDTDSPSSSLPTTTALRWVADTFCPSSLPPPSNGRGTNNHHLSYLRPRMGCGHIFLVTFIAPGRQTLISLGNVVFIVAQRPIGEPSAYSRFPCRHQTGGTLCTYISKSVPVSSRQRSKHINPRRPCLLQCGRGVRSVHPHHHPCPRESDDRSMSFVIVVAAQRNVGISIVQSSSPQILVAGLLEAHCVNAPWTPLGERWRRVGSHSSALSSPSENGGVVESSLSSPPRRGRGAREASSS